MTDQGSERFPNNRRFCGRRSVDFLFEFLRFSQGINTCRILSRTLCWAAIYWTTSYGIPSPRSNSLFHKKDDRSNEELWSGLGSCEEEGPREPLGDAGASNFFLLANGVRSTVALASPCSISPTGPTLTSHNFESDTAI